MKIRIIKKVTVASGPPRHRAFPSLEKLSDGSLLVSYREGTDHWKTKDGTVRVVKSKDEGSTWSEPKTILEEPGRSFGAHPGLAQLKSGVILCPITEVIEGDKPKEDRYQNVPMEGHSYSYITGLPEFRWYRSSYIMSRWLLSAHIIRSFDQGESWSELERLPLLNEFWWQNTFGKILEIDKEVWLPVGGQKKGEMFWRTRILKSFDEGKSWTDYVTVASKLGDEKSIIRLPSGRFLAMIRDLQTPFLYKCYSEDNGNTWSAISNSGIIGQCPCLFLTKKGQLLCSYRDRRPDHKGLGLSYSVNEGEDWYEWGHLYSSGKDDLDHSYPSMAYLDSGNIFCVYYASFISGNNNIEGVEIAID